jgi:hypothetical protein
MRNSTTDISHPITGESAMTRLYLSPGASPENSRRTVRLPLSVAGTRGGLVSLELLLPENPSTQDGKPRS